MTDNPTPHSCADPEEFRSRVIDAIAIISNMARLWTQEVDIEEVMESCDRLAPIAQAVQHLTGNTRDEMLMKLAERGRDELMGHAAAHATLMLQKDPNGQA